MNRNIIIASIVLICVFVLNYEHQSFEEKVNVYGWYGIIDRSILSDFEKETGIKVVYDVYDNNDSLEAKLLATNSGYDIVFPSFIPYGARQLNMGAYQKLEMNLIPNIKNIDGKITEKYESVGGDKNYLVPIFWGTVGIAYDANVLSKLFPNENLDSYDFLLNPEKIAKISKYGISFPEEYIDIFPQMSVYLYDGDSANIKDPKKVEKYVEHFRSIRKYIKKFSSNTMINDLITGEVCIAIGSSDNAWRARKAGKLVGKNIKYVIPKQGGVLWVDCVGIPMKAPHKKNAHKLLNYLLRPEIAARITNNSGILANIPSAFKMFERKVTKNDQICPMNEEVISNLIMGEPDKNQEDSKNDKNATRSWTKVKMNDFQNTEKAQ